MLLVKKISLSLFLSSSLLIPALCFGINYQEQIQEQKKELEEMKKQLSAEKEELQQLIKKQSNVLKQTEQIEQNITLAERYIKKLNETQNMLQESAEKTEQELHRLQENLHSQYESMSKRVRDWYISGRSKNLNMWFNREGELDLWRGTYYLHRLVGYDNFLVSQIQEKKQAETNMYLEYQNRLEEMQEFKSHKADEVSKFEKEKKGLLKTSAKLKNDESAKRKALEEMEKNAIAISKIIKTLEQKRQEELKKKKKPKTLDKKGKGCQPVNGPITSKFGLKYHATLKTSTKNLGVEYLGEAGEAVVAAAGGEVVYVDRIPGYGRGIIIYNGSGYYNIYGNIENIKVKVGDMVKGCSEIARISAKKNKLSRQIYFEVRKEKNPIDPVEWLKTMIN